MRGVDEGDIGRPPSELAHDLKTPLTVIVGYAEILLARNDARTRLLAAERIHEAAGVLSARIDRLTGDTGVEALVQRSSRGVDRSEMSSALSLQPIVRPSCVLVVDDEPGVRDLIARVLTGSGHRVVTAASAQEAIRIVEDEDVALVLSDINMPGSLSGLELIDALHELRPSLPIVLVTGMGDEASLQEALDRGAAGFITKPFSADGLRNKVATALDRLSLAEADVRERLLAPTVASVLANAVELRDTSMEGHTERLASLALEIGRRCDLSAADLHTLEVGAVLHDVGKIGIADSILLKPGAITADERSVMEQHTTIGDLMLAPLALLEPVREIVRHHHERWDGAGYPDGLAENTIPQLARIVAVADSIEAMSGDRPYRSPLRKEDILNELRSGRGGQWDPALVDIALVLIDGGQLRFGPSGMSLLAA
jgi:response regulator RpfG family c-di-GMP phosphodiesterase